MSPASHSPEAQEATHRSVWMDTGGEAPTFPTLGHNLDVDVAIVGSGIVGMTAAAQLAGEGLDVALIEKGRVSGGVTSHSTAKLTSNHGLLYQDIAEAFGDERARQYAAANQRAIQFVEEEASLRGIDCDFERTFATTYTDMDDHVARVRREVEVASDLGLPVQYVDDVSATPEAKAGIRYDDQAQFHPRKYLLGLVAQLSNSIDIYEKTRAVDLDSSNDRPVVKTTGGRIEADHVLVATHFPFHDPAMYFARLVPRYSYLLSVELSERAPDGLYYRMPDPYFTFRPHPNGHERQALVGGLNHRTGHGGHALEAVARIQAEAAERFPIERVTHYWSTQDFESVDGVPMVGPIRAGRERVLVATGFGGWGLSNGTAAGILMASRVLGANVSWGEVYDPNRFKLGASAKKLWEHNNRAGQHWIKDKLGLSGHETRFAGLAPGKARVVGTPKGAVAAFRDDDGTLYTRSAECTHMGCHVAWNEEAMSWDCPCHGSRFDVDGTVIDGPAVTDLPAMRLTEPEEHQMEREPEAR